MPLQDSYVQSSEFTVGFVDRYGQKATSHVKIPGSFAAQMATIAGAIGNSSNAAAIKSKSGLVADAELPYLAFDEAESSVRSVLVLKFHQDAGDPNDFAYIEIPAFDASLLLAGQPFANPAQTQIAAIIGAMTTGGYTYYGSWVDSRAGKSLKQPIVAGLEEPEEGLLPAGLPDADNEPGVQTVDPED